MVIFFLVDLISRCSSAPREGFIRGIWTPCPNCHLSLPTCFTIYLHRICTKLLFLENWRRRRRQVSNLNQKLELDWNPGPSALRDWRTTTCIFNLDSILLYIICLIRLICALYGWGKRHDRVKIISTTPSKKKTYVCQCLDASLKYLIILSIIIKLCTERWAILKTIKI